MPAGIVAIEFVVQRRHRHRRRRRLLDSVLLCDAFATQRRRGRFRRWPWMIVKAFRLSKK